MSTVVVQVRMHQSGNCDACSCPSVQSACGAWLACKVYRGVGAMTMLGMADAARRPRHTGGSLQKKTRQIGLTSDQKL